MKRLLFLLLTLTSGFRIQAQYGYITGQVYDNFGPLSDVNVDITDTPYGTFTDVNGYFAFELDTGQYEIRVNLSGYEEHVRIISLENLQQIELDFGLQSQLMDASVSIGSKSNIAQNQMESPAPIDVIFSKDLIATGKPTLTQALHILVPYFHSVVQSTAEGTDFINPISLRGLSSDQLLVLINGKRRHKSAFLHVNEIFGKGTAGTDLNTIPIVAIDKIEILRDGASSQYGSDAIAGVMNIILKEKTGAVKAMVQSGITQELDGEMQKISLNNGFGLRKDGYINFSAEFINQAPMNRSGDYTGIIYNDERDEDPEAVAEFFDQTGFEGNRVAELGNTAGTNAALMYNMSIPLTDYIDLYSFGGINYRNDQTKGIYRFPSDEKLFVPEIYSLGLAPEIHTDIFDQSTSFGLAGEINKWQLDFNYSQGQSSLDISVFNSNNASLGTQTPVSAYSGGYEYGQHLISFDATRSFKLEKAHYELSFGSVFRLESYKIIEGEIVSYSNGSDTTDTGESRVYGMQGYHGIADTERLDELRSNAAAYVELDYEFNKKLVLEGAIRYETYSDFGGHYNFKLAGRYKFLNQLLLRASYSTGFKAPSLPQLYYRRQETLLEDDQLVDIYNFNTESALFKALGLPSLDPELSENIGIGITSRINRNISLSVDAYQIDLKDRISLSSRVEVENYEILRTLLGVSSIREVEFFFNGVDTRTRGIDAVVAAQFELGRLSINAQSMYSQMYTRQLGDFSVTGVFQGEEELIFDREDQALIENYVPSYKWSSRVNLGFTKFSVGASFVRFGEVTYLHPDDGNADSWTLNETTGDIETRDQVFNPRNIINLESSFRISNAITLTAGVNNLLNTFPDQYYHSENQSNGVFTYSTKARQYDLDGRFYHARLLFQF